MVILPILATSVAAAYTANGFDFSAASADNVTATICIGGTVPVVSLDTITNELGLVSLGVTQQMPLKKTTEHLDWSRNSVGMGGADISIAFADDSSKPTLIHGSGMLADRPNSFETMNATKSSYTGGVLKVCLDRFPNHGHLDWERGPNWILQFPWATGKVSNGRALQHAGTDRGLILNVTLFGDAATRSTGLPTASAATASPSGMGKSSSSKNHGFTTAVFLGVAALLA
ncbi:hypothetical protein BC830DRAFT_1224628 [Chytriomyces sp. MP71]|nr:hypothetical protein BC830DRAFT_1224628 [Chytriomyces sp. MP71]